MIEQHVDGGCDLPGCSLIHRIEHPNGFRKHKVRNPRTTRGELFSNLDLFKIIAHDESYHDVGINRQRKLDGRFTGGKTGSEFRLLSRVDPHGQAVARICNQWPPALGADPFLDGSVRAKTLTMKWCDARVSALPLVETARRTLC